MNCGPPVVILAISVVNLGPTVDNFGVVNFGLVLNGFLVVAELVHVPHVFGHHFLTNLKRSHCVFH